MPHSACVDTAGSDGKLRTAANEVVSVSDRLPTYLVTTDVGIDSFCSFKDELEDYIPACRST